MGRRGNRRPFCKWVIALRKLLWVTVGFAAGCALCAYAGIGYWLWIAAGVCLGAGVLLYGLIRGVSWRRIAGLVVIGFALGCIWFGLYDGIFLRDARAVDGEIIRTEIRISDYGYKTNSGVAAKGQIAISDSKYTIRVYVPQNMELKPGDLLDGEFALYFASVNGLEKPSSLQSEGIQLQAFADSDVVHYPGARSDWTDYPAILRYKILNLITEIFPEDVAGFAKALLLGDSTDLTQQQDIGFKNSGIRHIIAVSGLHVSILFSMLVVFTGHRKFLTVVLGIPLLVIFAAVSGFTPSVSRACIMQGLILLALALDKEYDPPTALAVAVLEILCVNPMNIASIGFQLSVSCVVGIFLCYNRIHSFMLRPKWMNLGKGHSLGAKLIRWFASSVAVSLSAVLFTLPLSAIHFRSINLIGVISNLLTLWAVTYIFYGIIAACILGAIYAPAGSAVAWLIAWLMRYVSAAAILLGKVPFANIPADGVYITLWIFFLYAMIALFLFGKRRYLSVLCACLCVTLGISIFATAFEGRKDAFRVTVLDVGQGQCVLLQSGGSCYMVDCGGDSPKATADAAVRALWNQGIYELDGIILTHFDQDHVNGLHPLLVQVDSKCLYLPETEDKDHIRIELEAAFDGEKLGVNRITELSCGQGKITIIPAFDGAQGNESSMCILFQAADCDILITGDRNIAGEEQLLGQVALPDIDVLVVGHHGSRSSTGYPLLQATKPEIAVISVGEDNLYNHPEQEMLDRLEYFGCKILRTDIDGNITLRR